MLAIETDLTTSRLSGHSKYSREVNLCDSQLAILHKVGAGRQVFQDINFHNPSMYDVLIDLQYYVKSFCEIKKTYSLHLQTKLNEECGLIKFCFNSTDFPICN